MQNYREIVDAVLKKFPLYDANQAKQDVNDNLRVLVARRPWSGLVRQGILSVPAAYSTGTVTATLGSNVVTGSSTVWLFDDLVNTTLSTATLESGIVDMTPASMTGIIPGRWVVIDGGAAGEEAVYVISTDTEAGTFRARTSRTHAAAVTIKAGSHAGRQFRTGSSSPLITAAGFTSATRMLLDRPFPSSTVTGVTYELTKAWVSLGMDVKEILTMVNLERHYQFDVFTPKTAIDAIDPRRNQSGMPWRCVFHETDPAGAPLYELWPRPTSAAAYPYFYIRAWEPLSHDNDIIPNGIRSDVLVKMGRAEAARWPGHKNLEGGIYYDPRLATELLNETERDIAYMKNEDDSTAIMQLVYQYRRFRFGGGGQEHEYDSMAEFV